MAPNYSKPRQRLKVFLLFHFINFFCFFPRSSSRSPFVNWLWLLKPHADTVPTSPHYRCAILMDFRLASIFHMLHGLNRVIGREESALGTISSTLLCGFPCSRGILNWLFDGREDFQVPFFFLRSFRSLRGVCIWSPRETNLWYHTCKASFWPRDSSRPKPD